jgi:hypothetical protein
MDFFASGTSLTNGSQIVGIDTDLTLWAALKDLRQDPGEPFGECFKEAICGPPATCAVDSICEGACFFTAEGPTRCFAGENIPGSPCGSDSDCPPGYACAANCAGQICTPLCGTTDGLREAPVTAGVNAGARTSKH